jgi:putative flippase GtrA
VSTALRFVSFEPVKELIARNQRFLRYCVLGSAGVIADFGTYAALVNLCGLHHQIANALSTSCGIVTSFWLNAAYTFQTRDRLWLRFLSFYAVGLLGLALSAATLWLLVDHLDLNKNWSKLATAYVVIVQYNLNRRLSFAK